MHMPTALYNQQTFSATGITNSLQTSALFVRKANAINIAKEK